MLPHRVTAGVDELLDHASDAVARNDWRLAQTFAEIVLQQVPDHAEAVLILRTASAYLEADHSPDPFSVSRDLRFMSIMFCDVVGSTRLARELGDVAWRDALERFRRRCARAVRRYDGFIHEASGDELLILFGYPRVREDDARRAVLAGLDVIAAVQAFSVQLQRERRRSFQCRVGIHTGRALIKERPRGANTQSDTSIAGGLVGEAAHIAKRIESIASPDSVWVSAATRQIVEGFFEFANPPDGERRVELAGRPPVAAYGVTRPTAALNRHQLARVRADEMFGRRAERDRLLALWEQARGGGAPFVIVSGAAGIGKSRLVEFLAETAAGSRGNRLECICTEILKPVALAPLIGLIERFANIRQADTSETRLTKLEAAFRALAPGLEGFVPHLAWMMSIPQPGNAEVQRIEPEAARNEIFDVLLKLLTLVASIRPSVLWIEDIQWADHSTLEFCRRLTGAGPIPGLIVIATVRTGLDEGAGLAWSEGQDDASHLVRIELEKLTAAESRQLIASRAGTALDEGIAAAILESTGGIPLYIEEVVRSVITGGDAKARAGDPADVSIAIPVSLQPIFAQIVDRLGVDRQIAQIASLLGRELVEPLTRVVIARILGMSEDEVMRGIERLIDAEIIEPILTELSPGFRFGHDLIREALVYSVGADASENHGRIATIIEQLFPDIAHDRPALLAYHFAKAEQHERAAGYALKAGMSLQAKAAHQEAIVSFKQGLDSVARIAPTDATARLEMLLRASRGVSIQTVRGYTDPIAGRDWSRAYELSKVIGASREAVSALGGLWSFYFVRGAHTFVSDLGTTSIAVSEQIIAAAPDDPDAQAIGRGCLVYSCYFGGRLRAGRASAERSWQLREHIKERPPNIHTPQDPLLAAISLLAPVRWSLGDHLGAREAAEHSTALATMLESKRALNLVRVGLDITWMHHIRRDYESARDSADRTLKLAMEFHVDWAVVNLSIHRALALAHLATQNDDIRNALATATEFLGYWRAAGAETMVSYFLGEMAEAHRLSGNPEAAVRVATEAIELGKTNGEHFHDAELHRIRGQAHVARGAHEREAGRDDLLLAVAIAREQDAVSFEIRSIVSLLTLVPELPERRSWLDQLETALGRLQSSESGVDEREARALMTSAGVPSRARDETGARTERRQWR